MKIVIKKSTGLLIGSKKQEVTVGRQKLRNKELLYLCSLNTVGTVKSRKISSVAHEGKGTKYF
jgi:hypothetical protein